MEPSASTRPRSAPIMTRRRRIRSTHTPAGSPTIRKAAVDAAVSSPISKVVACSVPHRQERDGEQADLRAQLADGLAAPEQPEVAVAPEGSLGHRRTITRGGQPAARHPGGSAPTP